MSDFDSNPFADPEAQNPFADPSVQQNTWNQQSRGGLEEFNPFVEGNSNRSAPQSNIPPPQAATQPAVMQPTQDPPPPYTPQSQAQAGTDDLKRRQDELERKAAELQRKEQELQRNLGHQARINNFPPLPQKCCVQPCFYQDFELDIPLEFQKIVKTIYYVWISYVCLLFVNVIGALAFFIAVTQTQDSSTSAGTTFGVSILYLFLFAPCSFVCWYRPVYKAFRSDSSFNFFLFFFVFFFQFCVCILQALGISGWGTVGLISALNTFAKSKPAAAIMLIIGILFACLAVIVLALLIKVHRIYRSTGASFAKAQQEFAQGVMSNKNVQSAASEAGAAAVRGAMTNNQQADNRY